MNTNYVTVFVSLILLFIFQISNAQIVSEGDTILDEELSQVVVTGTRTEKTIKNTPVLTQVIGSKQYIKTGFTQVSDLIQMNMPGMEFYNDGRGSTMRLQGLGPKYNLFLIDGEKLSGENRDNPDYLRMSTANIERIEIIKGAASSLYGSTAMGGVINIITRESKKNFEAESFSKYSSINEFDQNLNIGLKNKTFNSYTSYSYKNHRGYDLSPETPDLYTLEPYQMHQLNQKLKININQRNTITAKLNIYQREQFDVSSVPSHKFYSDYSGGLQYKLQASNTCDLIISYYGDKYSDFLVLERKNNEKKLKYNDEQHTIRTQFNIKISEKQDFTLGAEYFYDNIFTERIENNNKSSETTSLFGQYNIKLHKRTNLTAGYRGDYHSEFGINMAPKISIMYSLEKFIFRGNLGYGYRTPGLKERYYNMDLGFLTFVGNKYLLPEKSIHAGISGEYISRRIKSSVSIYHNQISDMIFEYLIPGTLSNFTYMNVKNASITGVELLTRIFFLSNLNANLGIHSSKALDLTKDTALIGNHLYSGNIGFEYRFDIENIEFETGMQSRFYSSKSYEDFKPNSFEYEVKSYPAYSIERFFFNTIWYKKVIVSMGIDNILNKKGNSDLINIDPGRRYFLSLRLNW